MKITIAAALLLGLTACTVWPRDGVADDGLYGITFEVPAGRTNNVTHETGHFIVFKTSFDPVHNGLIFLAKKGDFANSALVCDDAPFDDKTKSYKCVKLVTRGKTLFIETLTVGSIVDDEAGTFCANLRTRPGLGNKVMTKSQCGAAGFSQCACYDLDAEQYPPGGEPPGKGAGSGGSN